MKQILILIALALAITNSFAQQLEALQWRREEALRKDRRSKEMMEFAQALTPNQLTYDVKYYDLRIDIDTQQQTIDASLLMRAQMLAAGVNRIELDLHQQLGVSSVTRGGVNGDLGFERQDNLLIIHLDRESELGETIELTVYYGGHPPYGGTFGSFGFSQHNGREMIWSLSEPFGARYWWPCKDYPSDKADSVDIRCTVPEHLVVASNGTLRDATAKDGRITYWWHEQYPIATYLVSLAIHPYAVYSDWFVYGESDSMEVKFFVYPDHLQVVQTNYAKTVPMIEVFSDLYGLYPFIEEKYGHAEFVWGGGMEHQTITSLGGYSEDLIVHELAHMWWGDMITCDSFHHIWLNEGFAVYSEALWHEKAYGRQALHSKMAMERYLGGGTIYVENPESDNIFDGNLSYSKASWVLHMLRHIAGDDVFFSILREYRNRYEFKTATTEQFRQVCEEISGLDLQNFFQQWIYAEGHPFYEFLWEAEECGNGMAIVHGQIRQKQSVGPIFHMPVDVRVRTAVQETTVVIFNDQAVQNFSFTVSGAPVSVALDPDEWILRRIETIDQPRLALVETHVCERAGDGDGVFEANEEADLIIALQNSGVSADQVNAHLSCLTEDVEVVVDQAVYASLKLNQTAENIGSPFRLRAKPNPAKRIVPFQLTLTAGEFSLAFDFTLSVGEATLLLVDDDQGENYQNCYRQMVEQTDRICRIWSVAENGVAALQELQGYDAVVWFTGDDRDSSLTSAEQTVIRAYLDSGGRLLLSGQNIGFDLAADGCAADSLFYRDVLHAQFIADATSNYALLGVSGDPIADRLSVRFTGPYPQANNQISQSVISAIAPANTFIQYIPSYTGAGIRYENEENGSRLVYLAFGMEGIAGLQKNSAADLLDHILAWLQPNMTGAHKPLFDIPHGFVLTQNYPNPFNPETRVVLQLMETAQVEARVVNVLGQEIRRLGDARFTAGAHTIHWDGNNNNGETVGAGLYWLQVQIQGKNGSSHFRTVKMVRLP